MAGLGDRRLRIGVAGAGAISPYHLMGWQALGNVDRRAICDPDLARARARADEFGFERVYADFGEMLAAEQLDAVDIVTPVGTHAPLVRLAADAGVHVCCQKPLCPTVAEARELIAYVGDRVRFMVHENYRFRPHYVALRQWLAEGRIGQVRHARMTVRSASCLTADGTEPALLKRQPYLRQFRRLLVFEVLIHQLDVMRVLLGPLEVRAARLARMNPELLGEDVATVLLSGRDDMTVLLDGDISAPGYPPMPVDRFEILGDRGSAVYDRDRLFLEGDPASARTFDLVKNYPVCFTAAVEHFVRCLRTGAPFETDRLDNLETLVLMESVYRAAGLEV